METNPNIIRLLEMLDCPEAYSEEEIRAIIDSDDETREAYHLMVAAKQGYTHRQGKQHADVQAAWQRFCENEKIRNVENEYDAQSISHSHIISFPKFQKIAASFIGILFVSGIAFAAIHIVRQQQRSEAPKTELTENAATTAVTIPADTLASDTVTVQPVIYDNIPLEKMLPEIAAHYDATVSFANDEARQLRFRFVWNPQQGIDQVVSDLNQFERLKVTIKDRQIIVE